MEGQETIKDQPSYITLAEADAYMTVNVSVTGWVEAETGPPVVESVPTVDEKENYILSAYQEINPDDIETEVEGKRTQLTLLSIIFMDKADYYKNKQLKASGVKGFTNSKLKVDFRDDSKSVTGGGNIGDEGGNDIIDL